jgi:hypothetical protein
MLNHGNSQNSNIPNYIYIWIYIWLGFIFLIHQEIKWRNNLMIFFEVLLFWHREHL